MQELAGTFIGKKMLMYQVDSQSCKGGSILHRSVHPLGKGSLGELMASRTQLAFALMLNDVSALGRKVNHLPTHQRKGGLLVQILLTVLARRHWMKDDFIGIRLQIQGIALMSPLFSMFLATALTQALGLAGKAI